MPWYLRTPFLPIVIDFAVVEKSIIWTVTAGDDGNVYISLKIMTTRFGHCRKQQFFNKYDLRKENRHDLNPGDRKRFTGSMMHSSTSGDNMNAHTGVASTYYTTRRVRIGTWRSWLRTCINTIYLWHSWSSGLRSPLKRSKAILFYVYVLHN